ncbi:hypothetical protein CIK06_23100 [Plantactinospora sp. KBS50]|nr:hypothetical protein CIK06_23100 [Plantactinospora sp. KBS50]
MLTRSGRLLVVEDGAALIGELLQLGAAQGPSSGVAKWLAAGPPDWDDRHLVGVFRPEFVRQAAEFLAAAPIDEWSDRFRPDLAAFAGSLDPARCYDDERHTALRRHAAALAELFGRAAEDGEAVIEKLSA